MRLNRPPPCISPRRVRRSLDFKQNKKTAWPLTVRHRSRAHAARPTASRPPARLDKARNRATEGRYATNYTGQGGQGLQRRETRHSAPIARAGALLPGHRGRAGCVCPLRTYMVQRWRLLIAPLVYPPWGGGVAPPCRSEATGQRAASFLLLEELKKKGCPAHGTAPQPRSRGKACQFSCDYIWRG
jgi:hypothetical protein